MDGYQSRPLSVHCFYLLLHGNAIHCIRLTQQANLVFCEFLHRGPAGALVGLHVHASEG